MSGFLKRFVMSMVASKLERRAGHNAAARGLLHEVNHRLGRGHYPYGHAPYGQAPYGYQPYGHRPGAGYHGHYKHRGGYHGHYRHGGGYHGHYKRRRWL